MAETYDVEGILKKKAQQTGLLTNPIDSTLLNNINKEISGISNPALAVSAIQKAGLASSPVTTPKPSGAMTLEEAKDKYGTDFTGINQGEGGYYYNTGERKLPTPTQTIDSAMAKVTTPSLISNLPTDEATLKAEELQSRINQLNLESERKIENIKKIGTGKISASKSLLSKFGALGTTLSGAPIETGLGALSTIQNNIDKAIAEEKSNLEVAIANEKIGNQKAIQNRIDELNKLTQQNFDNALEIVQNDRAASAEQRSAAMDEINIKKLNWEMSKTEKADNKQEVLDQIDVLADAGVSLDQLTLAQITDYETRAGLPAGTFAKYYQAKLDANQVASEENQLKLDKLKAEVLKAESEAEDVDTQVVNVGGVKYLINKKTGETIKVIGGGNSGLVAGTDQTGITQPSSKELDKLLTNYPIAFKSYIKSISGSADFPLNSDSIGQMYEQYQSMGGPQDQDKNNVAADIQAITGPDGFVDTEKYRQIRSKITGDADLLKWFESTYSPKKVLNPNDPTAQDLLGKTNTKKQTDLEKRITEFKNNGYDFNFVIKTFKNAGWNDSNTESVIRRIYGL